MNQTEICNYAATALAAVGGLVTLTNITVEVIKKLIAGAIPTQLVVFAVSQGLTLLSFFAWAESTGFSPVWYHIVGAVVLGILVAYAAMFGFDKLKSLLTAQNNLSTPPT